MNARKSVLRFGIGLTVGLLIGLGMVIGVLIVTGQRQTADSDSVLFPKELETRLHAFGSHGGNSFSIATGGACNVAGGSGMNAGEGTWPSDRQSSG